MTEQFFGKELAVRKSEAIPGLLEFDIRHPFEPRTQMLEFGNLVGKPSSKKAYTYALTAESEHELPEVDLLRKPSLLTRLIRRWRQRSTR